LPDGAPLEHAIEQLTGCGHLSVIGKRNRRVQLNVRIARRRPGGRDEERNRASSGAPKAYAYRIQGRVTK
jgi:hypothetical protein